MATITRYPWFRRLRSEPNQFILYYSGGRLRRKGTGIAFWFSPLSAALAQIPAEDCEMTFVLNERTRDFQDVSVQASVTFRIADAELASGRVNFSISPDTGRWLEQPLERLSTIMSQRALEPVRGYLTSVPLQETTRAGAAEIQSRLAESMLADDYFKPLGVEIVNVQVVRVAPTPELEKALQTPVREAIQQKADEAVFERRALAVEKERAIKENELATELELERRQQDLINQRGQNALRSAEAEAAAALARVRAEAERREVDAASSARAAQVRAEGEAAATRLERTALNEAEGVRVRQYSEALPHAVLGISLQEAAKRISAINNLNVTPELLGAVLQQALAPKGAK